MVMVIDYDAGDDNDGDDDDSDDDDNGEDDDDIDDDDSDDDDVFPPSVSTSLCADRSARKNLHQRQRLCGTRL